MQQSRDFLVRRKPRIILDKTFPIFKLLNVGDKGQCYITGSIAEERMETQADDTDMIIKTIQIDKVEIIENKESRITSSNPTAI